MPRDGTLAVNEIFASFQGEGRWTGTPAVFVRLQGCVVGCPWCDTKYTWALEERDEVRMKVVLDKIEAAPTYARMTPSEIAMTLANFPGAHHVVLTGGEPCDQDLTELTSLLVDGMSVVQVETSGTAPIRVHPNTWVTVSPKIGMPGGRVVLSESLHRANEIKMPVGRERDIETLARLVMPFVSTKEVWLQPLSLSDKATAICLAAAEKYGWRVSLQTHKFVGAR